MSEQPIKVTIDTAEIAQAIRDAFIAPMETEAEPGAFNLAEAAQAIATHLKYLGNADAATPYGAIEALGMVIKEGAERISTSLDGLAEAIRESKEKE